MQLGGMQKHAHRDTDRQDTIAFGLAQKIYGKT